MFQGAALLTIDAKGRMAVPSKHRDALLALSQGRVTITAHPHRCLLLYPTPAWVPIREQILAASGLQADSALIKRLLVGFADDMDLDNAGRVLISSALRRYAGLEKEVWMVGQGSHFEIWSDAGWNEQQEAIFALGDKLLPAGLENLAL